MEQAEVGLESGKKATASTVSRLVFEICDGIQRANDALLALAEYEAFAHQRNSLHEDAEQLREFRGDIFDSFIQTWVGMESEEAEELRVKRRVREELARRADKDFLNRDH
jgi:hypothetical protein